MMSNTLIEFPWETMRYQKIDWKRRMLWTIAVWAERILAVSRGREQYSQPGALGHTQVHSSALRYTQVRSHWRLQPNWAVNWSPVNWSPGHLSPIKWFTERSHCGDREQIDLSTSGLPACQPGGWTINFKACFTPTSNTLPWCFWKCFPSYFPQEIVILYQVALQLCTWEVE